MKPKRFTLCILLATTVCWAGCGEKSDISINPTAGWQIDFEQKHNQAIEKDYQDYIQKLPPGERSRANVSVSGLLKDGTGQHAITIEIPLNGTWWNHVLIYDKDNKRIDVIKYKAGHYGC